MANSSLNVTSLDFDEIKTSLKDFMRAQPRFSDVDFEGSNINVLLDVLSYNTYLNSFYLNMVASEMFIDTAQLRSSMISHAKALNYLPRSRRSALAYVNISITPTTSTPTVTIPAGTEFSTRVGMIVLHSQPTKILCCCPTRAPLLPATLQYMKALIVKMRSSWTHQTQCKDSYYRILISTPLALG